MGEGGYTSPVPVSASEFLRYKYRPHICVETLAYSVLRSLFESAGDVLNSVIYDVRTWPGLGIAARQQSPQQTEGGIVTLTTQ